MQLQCDTSVAEGYTSEAQRSRLISEAWFRSHAYCLSCDQERLCATSTNTKATDFVCSSCHQGYELKTFKTRPKKTLIDGSYHALLNRILDGSVPALMLLERNEQWEVRSLTSIHQLFLTPNVVQEPRPLSTSARRAGWIGCNIRLDLIAPDAYVEVVHEGRLNPREWVRKRFQRSGRLERIEPESRGWTTLALKLIRNLNQETFSLDSLYAQEDIVERVYPKNKNIRPKLRQQLQVLRDLGYLEFKGRGTYSLLT